MIKVGDSIIYMLWFLMQQVKGSFNELWHIMGLRATNRGLSKIDYEMEGHAQRT